ncbi:MAG: hypothetical protein ACI9WU_003433 [Myxococcota bacterium]|jgi:hypothetical protein
MSAPRPGFLPLPLPLPLLLLTLLSCSAEDTAPTDPGTPVDCTLVVVHSDYVSSAVSILNEDGSLCRDAVVTSGSASPGLTTALSADLSLPATPHPDGLVTIIDRTNAALTWLDPAADFAVAGQLTVSTGFAANPHDAIFPNPDTLWISRHHTNPTPGEQPFDQGGDILIVDPAASVITGRIDLGSLASVDHTPNPSRMRRIGDTIWLGLVHLSTDYLSGADGMLVPIAVADGTPGSPVTLTGLKNCTDFLPTPSESGLWVLCGGVFGDGAAGQLAASGLAYVDLTGAPKVTLSHSAGDFTTQPLGFSVVAPTDDQAWFIEFGGLAGTPERVRRFERSAGTFAETGIESTAFELGTLMLTNDRQRLYVPDGEPANPRIRRFALDGDTATELEPSDSNPSIGLPPRALGRIR